jgi:hypothetical protein
MMPAPWLRARRPFLGLALVLAAATPLYAKVKPPAAAPSGPRILFVGFMAEGTTGTAYVDLSQATAVTRHDGAGQVRFVLAGAVVLGENHQRPLPTEHFGTPIRQVRVIAEKDGATLELRLSGTPVVTHQLIRGDGPARLTVTAKPAASPPRTGGAT